MSPMMSDMTFLVTDVFFPDTNMPDMGPLLIQKDKISRTSEVWSDDIDDIQDPGYHNKAAGHSFNLYVGLQGPGWLYVFGILSEGCATFNRQSTCHGPRPRPKLAHGIRAGSLRATKPRAREKTRSRKRQKCQRA